MPCFDMQLTLIIGAAVPVVACYRGAKRMHVCLPLLARTASTSVWPSCEVPCGAAAVYTHSFARFAMPHMHT